jgi:two-component system sensor histidine kinase CreC
MQAIGSEIHLKVRDHGIGVEDYALPRLGERFFSTPRPAADGSGVDARKGSGLGLAIVREVVSLHRGRLQWSQALPGLQVDLWFPAGSTTSHPLHTLHRRLTGVFDTARIENPRRGR